MRSVSVIISSYNHGGYLAEAIRSALHQTHGEVEVIVVDDGSLDQSPAIAASFVPAIELVVKQNGGQASAWNVGFERASGEVVIFLDSDDRLLPTAAERAAEAALPSVSKVHWPAELIDAAGDGRGVSIPTDGDLPHGDRLDTVVAFGFDPGPNMPSSANAWSADLLREVLPIPEPPFVLAPDTYLLALSPLFGSTAAIASVQTQYRSHEQNNGARGSVAERSRAIVCRADVAFTVVARRLHSRGIHDVDIASWRACNPDYLQHLARSRALR